MATTVKLEDNFRAYIILPRSFTDIVHGPLTTTSISVQTTLRNWTFTLRYHPPHFCIYNDYRWHEFCRVHQLQVGDQLTFTNTAPLQYFVTFNGPAEHPAEPSQQPTISLSSGTETDVVMDSDDDTVSIMSISSDEEDDDNINSFQVYISQAHKKTVTIPLWFWQHHHLDSKDQLYMKFGNASASYEMALKYTHDTRPGCSDSLKITTGWPFFFKHCKMLVGEAWNFTIISTTYGPLQQDVLFRADLLSSNF